MSDMRMGVCETCITVVEEVPQQHCSGLVCLHSSDDEHVQLWHSVDASLA